MEAMTPWLLLIIAALIVACVSLYFHLRQIESQSRGEQSIITDDLREAEAALTSALEKIQRMDRELGARERALTGGATATLHAGQSVPPSAPSAEAGVSRDRRRRVRPSEPVLGRTAGATGDEGVRAPQSDKRIRIMLSSRNSAGVRARPASLGTVSSVQTSSRRAVPALWHVCNSLDERGDQLQKVTSPKLQERFLSGRPEAASAILPAQAAEQAPPDWREHAGEMARSGMTPREIARELELPVGEVELALALRS